MRELYQEAILDHNRRPRNRGSLADANRRADGYNPLCGDRIRLFLKIEDEIVKDVSFEGAGCAISTASASMMTQSVKGKSVAEAYALFEGFHAMATDDGERAGDLGKLEVFCGVKEFPARVKCATLAWHTLKAALTQPADSTTTE
ncbi:MAG: SUF system NifU family Fe-S cluster assembly protein [Candidatus Schekmanbacteria bacterium]|nr:SUF system NifU family Fe-S cluster assembly protein [Candidatus Schekmanbacteria bacterium]